MNKIIKLITITLTFLSVLIVKADPTWWADKGVTGATVNPGNNHATANQGQLLHIAHMAYDEMVEEWGEGVPGPILKEMVEIDFAQTLDPYVALNLETLSGITAPFFNRLQLLGLTPPQIWNQVLVDQHLMSPANVGQLKNLFSFELEPFSQTNDVTVFADTSHDQAFPAELLSYQVTVMNFGPQMVPFFRLAMPLPSGIVAVTNYPSACYEEAGVLYCEGFQLNSGSNMVFSLSLLTETNPSADEIAFEGELEVVGYDPNTSNNSFALSTSFVEQHSVSIAPLLFTLSDSNPDADELFDVQAVVENNGVADLTNVLVHVTDENSVLTSFIISELKAGELEAVSFSFAYSTEGAHVLQAVVDPFQTLDEDDLSDNTAQKPVFVGDVVSQIDFIVDVDWPVNPCAATLTRIGVTASYDLHGAGISQIVPASGVEVELDVPVPGINIVDNTERDGDVQLSFETPHVTNSYGVYVSVTDGTFNSITSSVIAVGGSCTLPGIAQVTMDNACDVEFFSDGIKTNTFSPAEDLIIKFPLVNTSHVPGSGNIHLYSNGAVVTNKRFGIGGAGPEGTFDPDIVYTTPSIPDSYVVLRAEAVMDKLDDPTDNQWVRIIKMGNPVEPIKGLVSLVSAPGAVFAGENSAAEYELSAWYEVPMSDGTTNSFPAAGATVRISLPELNVSENEIVSASGKVAVKVPVGVLEGIYNVEAQILPCDAIETMVLTSQVEVVELPLSGGDVMVYSSDIHFSQPFETSSVFATNDSSYVNATFRYALNTQEIVTVLLEDVHLDVYGNVTVETLIQTNVTLDGNGSYTLSAIYEAGSRGGHIMQARVIETFGPIGNNIAHRGFYVGELPELSQTPDPYSCNGRYLALPIELPHASLKESMAVAINNEGVVVGNYSLTNGATGSFLWDKGLVATLPLVEANDINLDNKIGGAEQKVNKPIAAATLESVSTSTILQHTSQAARILALNDSSKLVGSVGLSAFLYSNGQTNIVNGSQVSATSFIDINNGGLVLGYTKNNNKYLPVQYANSNLTTLAGINPSSSYENLSLNDNGVVCGTEISNGVEYIFIWDSGVLTHVVSPDGKGARAGKINNFGQLVGSTLTSSGTVEAGFLWSGTNVVDLLEQVELSFGGEDFDGYQRPLAINDNGQIVGYGSFRGAEKRAFLISPYCYDIDQDGMEDGWEVLHGFNPMNALDADEDADGDGLLNKHEETFGVDPRLSDTDGDGLSDLIEVNGFSGGFTDPLDPDTDGDGLSDFEEMLIYFTNPLDALADKDLDGLSDAEEILRSHYEVIETNSTWMAARSDAYAQGGHLATIRSSNEWELVLAQVGATNLTNTVFLGGTDQEQEGQWLWSNHEHWNFDRWLPGHPENLNSGEDYLSVSGVDADLRWVAATAEQKFDYLLERDIPTDHNSIDTDGDGLLDGPGTNLYTITGFVGIDLNNDNVWDGELDYGTDPRNPDTDFDQLPDVWEITWVLDPLSTNGVDGGGGDPDGDQLNNYLEFIHGTNPRLGDTDGDGMDDYYEVMNNLNPLAGSIENMLLWYEMNETTGTNILDSTNTFDGSSILDTSNTWAWGVIDKAHSFDGTNEWISLTNATPNVISNAFTLSTWIHPNTSVFGATQTVAWIDAALEISLVDRHLQLTLDGFTNPVISTNRLDNNAWSQIAITIAETNLALYVNAELVLSSNLSALVDLDVASLTLGAHPEKTNSAFNGIMDDFRIYSVALSSNDIQGNFEAGLDYDNDGYGNLHEFQAGTSATNANDKPFIQGDINGDGLLNGLDIDALNGLLNQNENRLTRYGYDLNGNLTNIVNALQETVAFKYNDNNQRIETIDALGRAVKTPRDAIGRVRHQEDREGHKVHYVYNEFNNVVEQIDQLTNSVTYSYNKLGQLLTRTDASNVVSKIEYDSLRRRKKIYEGFSLPEQRTIELTYDKNDNVEEVNYNNAYRIDKTHYDSMNRATNVVKAFGSPVQIQESFTYDDNGRLKEYYDARNETWKVKYDALGRVIQEIDPLNRTTTHTYDNLGNRVRTQSPSGREISYTYDQYNRVVKQQDGEYSASRQYDLLDRMVSQTDRRGHTTTYDYNKVGRLVKKIEALGTSDESISRYVYDANGRATSITNSLGKTLSYQYDAKGQLKKETDEKLLVTSYTYDAHGNLQTVTKPDNDVIAHDYDAMQQIKFVYVNGNQKQHFEYDAQGRLFVAGDYNGGNPGFSNQYHKVEHEYDQLGRMKWSKNGGKQVDYDYLDTGLVSLVDAGVGHKIEREYNAAGQLLHHKFNDQANFTTYNWDSHGRLDQIALANGSEENFDYDAYDRLSTFEHLKNGVSIDPLQKIEYDANNNVEKLLHNGALQNEWHYDAQNRITKKENNIGQALESWALDTMGNWTNYNTSVLNKTFAVNDANQYTQINTNNLAYDLNGNLETWVDPEFKENTDELTFEYDWANRLTEVKSNNVSIALYEYDAFNRRTKKETPVGGATTFVYDGYELLVATHADSEVQTFVSGHIIDRPVAMHSIKANSSTNTYYYHYDWRGSVKMVMDATNVVERYSYTTYGVTTIKSSAGVLRTESAIRNPFTFSGRYLDNESGLMYYRHRYYAPRLGRFIQKDPIGIADGLNRYQYAASNPNSNRDPMGTEYLQNWLNSNHPDILREIQGAFNRAVVNAGQNSRGNYIIDKSGRRVKTVRQAFNEFYSGNFYSDVKLLRYGKKSASSIRSRARRSGRRGGGGGGGGGGIGGGGGGGGGGRGGGGGGGGGRHPAQTNFNRVTAQSQEAGDSIVEVMDAPPSEEFSEEGQAVNDEEASQTEDSGAEGAPEDPDNPNTPEVEDETVAPVIVNTPWDSNYSTLFGISLLLLDALGIPRPDFSNGYTDPTTGVSFAERIETGNDSSSNISTLGDDNSPGGRTNPDGTFTFRTNHGDGQYTEHTFGVHVPNTTPDTETTRNPVADTVGTQQEQRMENTANNGAGGNDTINNYGSGNNGYTTLPGFENSNGGYTTLPGFSNPYGGGASASPTQPSAVAGLEQQLYDAQNPVAIDIPPSRAVENSINLAANGFTQLSEGGLFNTIEGTSKITTGVALSVGAEIIGAPGVEKQFHQSGHYYGQGEYGRAFEHGVYGTGQIALAVVGEVIAGLYLAGKVGANAADEVVDVVLDTAGNLITKGDGVSDSPKLLGVGPDAPSPTGFGGLTGATAAERSFLNNVSATFGDDVFTSAVRHRGNIVVQRSDIPLSIQNLRRMEAGNSPFVRNASGEWEALNLHHVGRQDGKLIEIFSSHNTYNPATGGPLHIPGPGGPVRQSGLSQTYWQQRLDDFISSGQVSDDLLHQLGQ